MIARQPDALGRDPHIVYAAFADLRAKRASLLNPGERFLTPEDLLQVGDSYMGSPPDWWAFKGGNASSGVGGYGIPVPIDCYCYTPVGSIERRFGTLST